MGTAFVHALANAQATAATGLELVLRPAQGCVLGPVPGHSPADEGVVALGAAHHGQARDVLVNVRTRPFAARGQPEPSPGQHILSAVVRPPG